MKKKILILLVIIALGIVAFVASDFFTETDISAGDDYSDRQTAGDSFNDIKPISTDDTFAGTDSVDALMRLGVPVECQIELAASTSESSLEGSYFIADEQVRGDFIQTTPGIEGTLLTSMIVANEMVYVWSEIDGEKFGSKLSLDSEAVTDDQRPLNPEDQVSYVCARWDNVDESIFEPPSDVLFQDMSDLLEAGMEYGTVYQEAAF